jgi:enamine deaminase RidA (YjgF/YER057c/UK114 family)
VAVRGGLLFLSGQVAQDPANGELTDGDIAQQADQILRNIAAPVKAIWMQTTGAALGAVKRCSPV